MSNWDHLIERCVMGRAGSSFMTNSKIPGRRFAVRGYPVPRCNGLPERFFVKDSLTNQCKMRPAKHDGPLDKEAATASARWGGEASGFRGFRERRGLTD